MAEDKDLDLINGERDYKSTIDIKMQKRSLIVKIILYFVLWFALLITIPFSLDIERVINRPSFSFELSAGKYAVHFVDVGQGDCTIIQLPDNKIVMIDTGSSTSRNNLSRYLSSMTFTTIDYLIITHPDEDHVGNAKMIFDEYKVLNAYVPKVSSNYMESRGLNVNHYKLISTKVWSNVTESMYNEGCSISYSFKDAPRITDGLSYSIDFFTPLQDTQSTSNDYSPVILVNIQNTKFMFTGDASAEKEQEFLNEYNDLIVGSPSYFDVDVLKVGHHGSKNSSKIEFLNVVKAEVAVISCGTGNKYGHPNPETLERLATAGCELSRTDRTGSVIVTKNESTSSPKAVDVKTDFNYNIDFYLEWNYVLIIGGVLLIILCPILFKKPKKRKEK